MKKLLFYEKVKRTLAVNFSLSLFFCSFCANISHSQVPQTPISDGGGTPVIYYDPLIDGLKPLIPYEYTKTCGFQDGSAYGNLMNPSVPIGSSYGPVTTLQRGSSYNFCGQAPVSFNAKYIRIVHTDDLGRCVDAIPLYSSFAPLLQYVSWQANNVKVGCIGTNQLNLPVKLPSVSTFNPLATNVRVEYYEKKDISGDRKVTQAYRIVAVRNFPLSKIELLKGAYPQIELVCEKGTQDIIIENPFNYPKVYIRDIDLFNLNPGTILDPTQANYTIINKSNIDGKFHFSTYVDTTRQYLYSYANPLNNEACDPLLTPVLLGKSSILTVLYFGFVPKIKLPDHQLIDCGDALDCNVPLINYYPLPNLSTTDDTISQKVTDYFNSLNLQGVKLSNSSSVTANIAWMDSAYITHDSIDKVCYHDLDGANCRTYTSRGTLNFNFRLQTTLDDTVTVPSEQFTCDRDLYEVKICQGYDIPEPAFLLKCSSEDELCLPCKPGVDGVIFYLGPDSLSDNTPEQIPPMKPTGLSISQSYSYYNCGEKFAPNKHDVAVKSTDPYLLKERFCYNAPTAEIGVLYAEYVRYDNNGNVIKRSPVRAPIAYMEMPNYIAGPEVPITIYKGLNANTTCLDGYSAHILPGTPANVNTSLDSLFANFNNYSLSGPGGITIPNPFTVTLQSDSIIHWEPQNHYSTGLDGINRVCYADSNHLDPEPGSERVYTQTASIKMIVTTPNICRPDIAQNADLKVCNLLTNKVRISKFMYPPKPDVHLICDMSAFDYELEQPIESVYPKYMWTPVAASSSDTFLTYGVFVNTATLIGDNNPSFISFQELFNHYASTNNRVISFNVQSYNPTYNRYSAPVQITFANGDMNTDPQPTEHFVFAPIANPNQYGDYCTTDTPEPGTYHDLSVSSNSFETIVNDLTNEIQNQYPGFSAINNFGVYWTPTSGYSQYTDSNNISHNRVCYGHLPNTQPKSQEYSAFFTANIEACINLSNTSLLSNNLPPELYNDGYLSQYSIGSNGILCENKNICPQNIAKQRVTELIETIDSCNITPQQIILAGGSSAAAGPCQTSFARTACAGDSFVLGTSIVVSPLATVTYVWTDPYNYPAAAGSLTSYTVAQPTWNYVNGLPSGTVLIYRCKITETPLVGPVVVKYHCEYVYLCGSCSTNFSQNSASRNQEKIISNYLPIDFVLAPNPADELVNVSQIQNVEGIFEVLIWDATGREMMRSTVQDSNDVLKFDTNALASGLYRIGIVQNGSILKMKNLIKE